MLIAKFVVLLEASSVLLCEANRPPSNYVKQVYECGIANFTAKILSLISVRPSKYIVPFCTLNMYAILGITHFVTDGTLAKQTANELALPNNDANIQYCLNDTMLTVQDSELAQVIIKGALFIRKDLRINGSSEILDKQINEYYRSAIYYVDYEPESSLSNTIDYINKWVSDHTKNRIPELLSIKYVANITLCLPVTTLYFKSNWLKKFDESFRGEFNGYIRTRTEVNFMSGTSNVPYTNNASMGYEAIALNFEDEEYALFVILPYCKENFLQLIEYVKTPENLNNLVKFAVTENRVPVKYKIPRLKFHEIDSVQYAFKSTRDEKLFNKAIFKNKLKVAFMENFFIINQASDVEFNEEGAVFSFASYVEFEKFIRPPTKATTDVPTFHGRHKRSVSEQSTPMVAIDESTVTQSTKIEGTAEDIPTSSDATAAQFAETSKISSDATIKFNADKPFLTFIYHNRSKTFLFTDVVFNLHKKYINLRYLALIYFYLLIFSFTLLLRELIEQKTTEIL